MNYKYLMKKRSSRLPWVGYGMSFVRNLDGGPQSCNKRYSSKAWAFQARVAPVNLVALHLSYHFWVAKEDSFHRALQTAVRTSAGRNTHCCSARKLCSYPRDFWVDQCQLQPKTRFRMFTWSYKDPLVSTVTTLTLRCGLDSTAAMPHSTSLGWLLHQNITQWCFF